MFFAENWDMRENNVKKNSHLLNIEELKQRGITRYDAEMLLAQGMYLPEPGQRRIRTRTPRKVTSKTKFGGVKKNGLVKNNVKRTLSISGRNGVDKNSKQISKKRAVPKKKAINRKRTKATTRKTFHRQDLDRIFQDFSQSSPPEDQTSSNEMVEDEVAEEEDNGVDDCSVSDCSSLTEECFTLPKRSPRKKSVARLKPAPSSPNSGLSNFIVDSGAPVFYLSNENAGDLNGASLNEPLFGNCMEERDDPDMLLAMSCDSEQWSSDMTSSPVSHQHDYTTRVVISNNSRPNIDVKPLKRKLVNSFSCDEAMPFLDFELNAINKKRPRQINSRTMKTVKMPVLVKERLSDESNDEDGFMFTTGVQHYRKVASSLNGKFPTSKSKILGNSESKCKNNKVRPVMTGVKKQADLTWLKPYCDVQSKQSGCDMVDWKIPKMKIAVRQDKEGLHTKKLNDPSPSKHEVVKTAVSQVNRPKNNGLLNSGKNLFESFQDQRLFGLNFQKDKTSPIESHNDKPSEVVHAEKPTTVVSLPNKSLIRASSRPSIFEAFQPNIFFDQPNKPL